MTYKEIDEMIRTVDKNGDGKINYSEFRVMMGAPPLLIPATTLSKFARQGNILREKNRRFEEKKEKNKIPSSFN